MQPIVRSYRGKTPEAAAQAYRADAAQAQTAGYVPISHRWAEDAEGHTLTVAYQLRGRPASDIQTAPPPTRRLAPEEPAEASATDDEPATYEQADYERADNEPAEFGFVDAEPDVDDLAPPHRPPAFSDTRAADGGTDFTRHASGAAPAVPAPSRAQGEGPRAAQLRPSPAAAAATS